MHIDSELAKTVETIFATGMVNKAGQMVTEGLWKKCKEAIAYIRERSPKLADALEAGNPQQVKPDMLEEIAPSPIFAEVIEAAEAEDNEAFQQLRAEIERLVQDNPHKLADKIGIVAQAFSTVKVENLNL